MKLTLTEMIQRLDDEKRLFVKGIDHGSMYVELYRPDKIDLQKPHDQDEIYVIVSGTGDFQNGSEVVKFQPHDVLFVPAGREHRFLNFTDDFKTWVIFYGPKEGEKNVEKKRMF